MKGKRALLLLLTILLMATLGLFVAAISFVRLYGSESTVKTLLQDSGAYKAMIPEQLLATQKTNPAFAGVPLKDPAIQNAIKDSFDSKTVNRSGDAVVSGYYDWLEGKTPEPQFDTEVRPDVDRLSASIGQIVAERAGTLPACGPADLKKGISADPFKATCLPPGITPETARQFTVKEIKNNTTAIQSAKLTGDTIRLPDGRQVHQVYPDAPETYRQSTYVPVVLAAISLLLIGALLWLGGLRRGSRYVSFGFILGGIAGIAMGVAVEPVLRAASKPLVNQLSSAPLKDSTQQLTHQASTMLQVSMLTTGIIIIGIGLVIWAAFRIATRHATK